MRAEELVEYQMSPTTSTLAKNTDGGEGEMPRDI